jgi:hypothetical protein
VVVRMHKPMREWLERYELMEKIDERRLYDTNRDAVAAFRQECAMT